MQTNIDYDDKNVEFSLPLSNPLANHIDDDTLKQQAEEFIQQLTNTRKIDDQKDADTDQKDADTDISDPEEIDIQQTCPGDEACDESCVENAESMYSVRYVKNKNQRYHRFHVPFNDFSASEIEVKTCKCRIMINGRREKATCAARSVEYLFKVISLPGTYLKDVEINTQVMVLRGKTTVFLWVPVKTH